MTISVRVLNPTCKPVTVYAGVQLVTMDQLEGYIAGGGDQSVGGPGGVWQGVGGRSVGGPGDGAGQFVRGLSDGGMFEGDTKAGAGVGVSVVTIGVEMSTEIIQNLIRESGGTLSQHEQDLFGELLHSYTDIIEWSSSELGKTDKLKHHTHTGDACTIRQQVRRIHHHH